MFVILTDVKGTLDPKLFLYCFLLFFLNTNIFQLIDTDSITPSTMAFFTRGLPNVVQVSVPTKRTSSNVNYVNKVCYFLVNLMVRFFIQNYCALICYFKLTRVNFNNCEDIICLRGFYPDCGVVHDNFLWLRLGFLYKITITGNLALIYFILVCLNFFFSRGFFHRATRLLNFLFITFLSL